MSNPPHDPEPSLSPPGGEESSSLLRRRLVLVAKMTLAAAILGFLLWQAQQSEALEHLLSQPKDWWMLGAAVALTLTAVSGTFVRWQLISRAAGIDLPLSEAFRFGAIGFALNFVGPGAVGGDLFKAVMLARGRAGQRTAAMTTIAVDRAMGLLTFLVIASVTILVLHSGEPVENSLVRLTMNWTLVFTGVGLAAVAILFVPGFVGPWLKRLVSGLPLVGDLLAQLVDAWGEYRRNPAWLLAAAVVCLVVDLLMIASFCCVAAGLPLDSPPLIHHLYIVPLGLTAGGLPITPNGFGTREAIVELLYNGLSVGDGQGALIAFGHSLTMLAAGAVATVYYLSRRSAVRAAASSPEVAGTV